MYIQSLPYCLGTLLSCSRFISSLNVTQKKSEKQFDPTFPLNNVAVHKLQKKKKKSKTRSCLVLNQRRNSCGGLHFTHVFNQNNITLFLFVPSDSVPNILVRIIVSKRIHIPMRTLEYTAFVKNALHKRTYAHTGETTWNWRPNSNA